MAACKPAPIRIENKRIPDPFRKESSAVSAASGKNVYFEIDLYLHQQALDTITPMGKAMFQMAGVFAELERAVIR